MGLKTRVCNFRFGQYGILREEKSYLYIISLPTTSKCASSWVFSGFEIVINIKCTYTAGFCRVICGDNVYKSSLKGTEKRLERKFARNVLVTSKL